MSFWRQLNHGLHALANRKATDKATVDEVDHYLEEATAALVDKGAPPEEARRTARAQLGSVTAVREQVRGYGWENLVEALFADLRYAARTLRGNPAFTVVSVLTLALGIGAATAIFSIVDAVLLRALPYPHAERIVRVWEQAPNGHRMNLADPNFDDLRDGNNTFAELANYGYKLSAVAGGSEPVRVNVAAVSRGFFQVFGVAPFRGRFFSAEEQRLHGAPAVIVSHGYWERYLGGTPDLTSARLKTEGGVYSVVGVMPAGFDFPAGTAVWIPSELYPEIDSRTAHSGRGIGRIREGVSLGQARANLSAIARRIKAEYGKRADLSDVAVVPLADAMVGDVRTAVWTLAAAVGLLLLVACANVAGLLLARTAARRKELAVRAALGAGRGRMIQQFLVESSLLAFFGGALGILFAVWAVELLPRLLPASLPRQQGVEINTPVLLFALAAMVVVAASLGLFGAWRAVAKDLQESLTQGARGSSGGVDNQRFRGFLVTGEIAVTLMILAAAGLLGRSFVRLISTDPGFQPQNLISMQFSAPRLEGQSSATEQPAKLRQVRLMEQILTRLRAIPGVESVGLAGAIPVAAGDNLSDGTFLLLRGQKAPGDFEEFERIAQNPSQTGHALYAVADDAYFRTLGIALRRGRTFQAADVWDAPHVAVISETLARQRWPKQDPIGESIEFGNMDGDLKPLTIVGVVGDVRVSGLDAAPGAVIYVDYQQRGLNANSAPAILMRSAAPMGETVFAARGVFHELAPESPVKFSTFAEEMGGWLADRRFLLLLVGVFAAAALSLAAVGIYGVVAFSVARRTQEIGIRMALGAQPSAVIRLIVGEGAGLAARGVVVGVPASLLVTRLLSSLLFGVSATDPITFAAVAGLLLLVALLASYIPARRGMRLDPNSALRYE